MKKGILIANCELLTHQGPKDIHSIYVRDGLIEHLSSDQTQRVPADTLLVDARGSTVLPGLIDSHCHIVQLGEMRRNVDLRGTTSVTSIRLRLFSRVQKTTPGEWIIGRGWDQEAIPGRDFPHHVDIDDVAPNNPVLLIRVCEHIGLLNSVAIGLLGMTDASQDPPGGVYERDTEGKLTGIIKETALGLVLRSLPPLEIRTIREDILRGEFEAAKNGLTTLHCILSTNYADELQAFLELKQSRGLSLRYRIFVPTEGLSFVKEKNYGELFDDDMVRLSGMKVFTDGSLGARTAALVEPYSDDPNTSGLLRYTDSELAEVFQTIASEGYQIAAHAIGDRAVAQCVDALRSLKLAGRNRVEHASVVDDENVHSLVEAKVGVTIQPHFVVSDSWANERLGVARLRKLYPFKSIFDSGVKVSGGSDAPVEPVSPILGFWAATTRDSSARDQRLSLLEALKLYTVNSAFNAKDEEALGTVSEGMVADLTLLDSNINGMHPEMIRNVRVAATMVDGGLIYSHEGYA